MYQIKERRYKHKGISISKQWIYWENSLILNASKIKTLGLPDDCELFLYFEHEDTEIFTSQMNTAMKQEVASKLEIEEISYEFLDLTRNIAIKELTIAQIGGDVVISMYLALVNQFSEVIYCSDSLLDIEIPQM